jgi:hypothetical protein
MSEDKNTAPGATNTESGNPKESESSVPDLTEKVKQAQAMGPMVCGPLPEPKVNFSLDTYTEMFMLDALRGVLNGNPLFTSADKWVIVNNLIGVCAEAGRI